MVELIIEGESVDLIPNEVVSLTMSINDLASIESTDGNYSNKFTIPSTSNNNSILGYPSEINFVSGFKPSKARNAKITIDGLDVQIGSIQVEQYNQTSKTFSVSFSSGNTEWIEDISDKNMTDINLDKYSHLYLPSVVAASFNNTSGYIYPFINYGKYDTIGDNNTNIQDWYPAMFTHTLIREMFASSGWKLKGSIFSDPVFLKHIIPFSIRELNQNQLSLNTLGMVYVGANGSVPANTTIVYPFKVNGNTAGSYNPTTGVYTAASTFRAAIQCSFFRNLTALDYIQVRRNGVVVEQQIANAMNIEMDIIIGDLITVTCSKASTTTATTPLELSRNVFIVLPLAGSIEGTNIDMAETMPDMSQEDFIKTIFNQFGIMFTTDSVSRTIHLNKFEDVKNNIPKALDWTNKIDDSRDIEVDYTDIVSDYSKKNTFRYKANEDWKISPNSSRVKSTGGDGSFDIDNDFLGKEDDIFESEFACSQNIPAFSGYANLMYIPRYTSAAVDYDKPDVDPFPRCGICVNDVSISGITSSVVSSININGASGTVNVTSVPYAYFNVPITNMEKVNDIDQSLSFGDKLLPNPKRTLLDSYYEDYIKILNNPRKITVYLLLNERDINNLDYLIPIYLGGELNNYFYVNVIKDYRPMDGGVAKVELILIV